MSQFNTGILELHLKDVLGQRINDEVRLTLDNFHLNSLDTRVDVNNFPVKLRLVASPQGIWTIYVQPSSYRALNVGEFVSILPDEIVKNERTLFIHSHLAKPVFPTKDTIFVDTEWSDLAELLANTTFLGEKGQALWELLSKFHPLLAAAVLNLYARSKLVVLPSQKNVFSYFQEIVEIRQDRIFVIVDPTLHKDVIQAKNTTKLLKEASGLLHRFPEPYKQELVQKPSSFKTPERTGNLQLTFAQDSSGKMMVDVDVDDHAGIKHAFDVLKHAFTGEKTHPYDIHQILTYFYNMDLGYRLIPKIT